MPYIIGTRNFNESVDGGLGAVVVDMSEEGEEQEDNAHEENRSGSGGDYNEDHNYNGYEDTYDEEKSVAASERDQSKYEASYDDDMSYTAPPPSGDAVRNMLNAQLSGGKIPAGPPPRGEQGFSIRDVDEGEEEEDDDIFTTQDDPYSLFGKPPGRESLIAKVFSLDGNYLSNLLTSISYFRALPKHRLLTFLGISLAKSGIDLTQTHQIILFLRGVKNLPLKLREKHPSPTYSVVGMMIHSLMLSLKPLKHRHLHYQIKRMKMMKSVLLLISPRKRVRTKKVCAQWIHHLFLELVYLQRMKVRASLGVQRRQHLKRN